MRILQKCKQHSKGTLWSFLAGFCVLYIFMNWVPEILGIFFPLTNTDIMINYGSEEYKSLLQNVPGTPMITIIYAVLLNGAFELGKCLYTLTYIRNKSADYRALAEGFSLFIKSFSVFIFRSLAVLFWSVFFIIPGIIAAINYSQVFYILADDPSKGVLQVMSESKYMMLGNRITYIKTLIVFLPYLIIAYTPAMILAYFGSADALGTVLFTVLALLMELPVFMAEGFMETGKCTFYELLVNKGFAYFKYAAQDAFRADD